MEQKWGVAGSNPGKSDKIKGREFFNSRRRLFFSLKKIPDQKGARSSASISRVCPGRVGVDPGTHLRSHKKPYADCGAAFHCSHGRLLSALVSSMARRLLATTSRIRKEEKKETKKIARGIFRSLAPLLGTAGSLSDCGIKPTIAELNFSRR